MAAGDTVAGARPFRARVGVSVAFFAQGFGFAVVLTHLAAFKDRWELNDLAITGVMFGVAVLAGAGSTVAGAIARRTGSSVALRAGLLVAAAGLVTAGRGGDLPVFLAGIGCYGIGLGMIDAAQNMQAVALETGRGQSILTSFHACWSAGGILGAVYTAVTHAWALSLDLPMVALVPMIAAGMPMLTGRLDSPAERPRLPWRALALLGAALVLFYVADSAASSWSTVYLRDALHASDFWAPLGYGAYQVTGLVSRIAGDHLVRRYGAPAVVRLAALIGVAGFGLLVLAPGPPVAIAGMAVLGGGLAVVAPLTFSAAGGLAGPADDEHHRQRADAIIAVLNQFNYLGFVLGGVLTGLVSSAGSMRLGFTIPWITTAALLVLAPAFGRQRQPSTQ